MAFESGVSWYTTGVASVPISFPEGEIRCQYCRFLRYNKDFRHYRCGLGLEEDYIMDPFSYDRGPNCPIIFEKTEF